MRAALSRDVLARAAPLCCCFVGCGCLACEHCCCGVRKVFGTVTAAFFFLKFIVELAHPVAVEGSDGKVTVETFGSHYGFRDVVRTVLLFPSLLIAVFCFRADDAPGLEAARFARVPTHGTELGLGRQ